MNEVGEEGGARVAIQNPPKLNWKGKNDQIVENEVAAAVLTKEGQRNDQVVENEVAAAVLTKESQRNNQIVDNEATKGAKEIGKLTWRKGVQEGMRWRSIEYKGLDFEERRTNTTSPLTVPMDKTNSTLPR